MDLIDLKRKTRELTAFINYQKAEIKEQRNTLKATNFDKELVSGTPSRHDISDVIAKIVEMEKDVEKAQAEYDRLKPLINELEEGYKDLGDRDKLIYLEYHCKGYSAIKIGHRYKITDKQVYKILKKVEKNIHEAKKCD